MILWLASYPKSGNTYLRSMLTAYFFTKDGLFDFDKLKYVKFFPHINLFKNLGIDITDEKEVVKNYIKAQESINKNYKKSLLFIKTHSTLSSINGHHFTNLDNTLGVIYIVRDPRNVVTSYSNHYETTLKQSAEDLVSFKYLKGIKDYNKFETNVLTHMGSWSDNYNSWKEFKKFNRYLLIKYEDLVLNPEKIFLSVLEFLSKIMNSKIKIDHKKLENVLLTTNFNNLQKLEKEKGFPEAINNKDQKKITFFKYGKKRDWKDTLPYEIKNKLESAFKKEMIELNYI